MYRVVPFKVEHLGQIINEPQNLYWKPLYETGSASALENEEIVTLFHKDTIHLCGGVVKYWPGRGHVWITFSTESKDKFVGTFRIMKNFLDDQLKRNFSRLEISVNCDYPRGRRRAELLGFTLECERAKKYLPDGTDVSIYSRVRE